MTKQKIKELFYPDYFYTMRIDKRTGSVNAYRTDGLIEKVVFENAYYYNERVAMWFVVDRSTGLSYISEDTLDEAYDKAHSEDVVKRLEEFKSTSKYKELSNRFYNEMVKLGVYVENMIKWCGNNE